MIRLGRYRYLQPTYLILSDPFIWIRIGRRDMFTIDRYVTDLIPGNSQP